MLVRLRKKESKQEKRDKWEKEIDAQKASNLSKRQWCLQRGISSTTFYYWKRKFKEEAAQQESPRFFEVLEEKISSEDSGLEISVGGVIVHLRKNFDEQTLVRCLHTLGGISC